MKLIEKFQWQGSKLFMKYYAVIDTNVIVSAVLKRHSVSGSVVELAIEGILIPILKKKLLKNIEPYL